MLLLEARNQLGGRAFSLRDRETGFVIDNCQHVLLGCCREAISFLKRIGSMHLVEFRESITLIDEDGRRLNIRPSCLPAPLHLAPSVMGSGYLSPSDRLRLIAVMAGIATRVPRKGANAYDYLHSLWCSDSLLRDLLEPVIVSALNEGARDASADYARMVLSATLLGRRDDYRLGVPSASLEDVLAAPAARYLAARGCEVRLGSRVLRIRHGGDGRVDAVVLASGEDISCDFCVCAVPPWQLVRMGVDVDSVQGLVWRSTVAAHLFFEQEPEELGEVCLVGEPFHWVFSKRAADGQAYLQALASGAGNIVDLPEANLVELAMRAVSKAAPGLRHACPRRAVIIRERRATFSTGGAIDLFRPPATTRWDNIVLAGDWTDTGWPATIESAVRSGRTAARALLGRT